MTLKQKIDEFRAVQSKWRKFGASDTEPNATFAYLMEQTLAGESVNIGKNFWQLYDGSMDCTDAHIELTNKANEVVYQVNNSPYHAVKQIANYYGWEI